MERQFYFLTPGMVKLALRFYADLDSRDNRAADCFFQTFGPGNTRQSLDRPAERFNDYEFLLYLLAKQDEQKYHRMHKGTPFYFLAWTAFEVGNFEKALFYLDAAISEDSRAAVGTWSTKPAGKLMTLETDDHVAQKIKERIKSVLDTELTGFRKRTGNETLTVDNFVSCFCKPALMEQNLRTSVSAFYTFLLEFQERYLELRLRSIAGGSMQLLLAHLFKGGLCLETLLKHKYPGSSRGSQNGTLGSIYHDPAFIDDFCKIVESTGAHSLKEIFNDVRDSSKEKTAFLTTVRIRNTSGHRLAWDDIFDDPDVYTRLYHQVINAILFVLARKWVA